MALRFTTLALHKLAERRIQPEWVERTVDDLEYVRPDPKQPEGVRAFRRIPEFGDLWLRAVFINRSGARLVITVTRDRDAERLG
jgi:hypothetical protein